jgi:UMF1 family MFS transporter
VHEPAPADDARPFRLFSVPVISWALFDFANTIFSFAVITRYFNDWIIDERGNPDWYVAVMGFVVGLVLVVALPALGAISDQVGRRLPFLAAATTVCVALTASLTFVDSTGAALVIAGIAIFAYQIALSMYDPTLALVAPPQRQGSVSGLGVGIGYLGTIAAILILIPLVPDDHNQRAFLPTALLFAVFAIPIFVFVREPRRTHSGARRTIGAALTQIVVTAGHVRREQRDVGRFLIARFLYVDAIATVIAYMAVYMGRVGDFSGAEKNVVLLLATVFAVISGFTCGRYVERLGPKRVLVAVLVLAVATLLIAAITGSAGLVWVLGPAIGVTLGGVATSDRVFMLRLSPPDVRGEYFGIYNLVGKLSAGIGPLVLWAGTIWLLHDQGDWSKLDASRAALAMLAVAVVAGLFVLRPLSDHDRNRPLLAEQV